MIYKPHNYQVTATSHIVSNPYCALFLDMGLGKTVSTLTAVEKLMYDEFSVCKVLVIAPKSVAQNTWTSECSKWDHLSDLKVSIVMGTEKQRRAALETEADIYVMNRDNTQWLVRQYSSGKWPFDMVVIDESTSFKTHTSARFKALKSVRPYISRLVELTGTPNPNGLLDLWAQVYLLDGGSRLGKNITAYRSRYFKPGRGNGQVVYEWLPRKGSREEITNAIADLCISMKSADYLTLPDVIDAGGSILLPELPHYEQFVRDQLIRVEGADIEAVTAAALSNKLLQFTGGAVYDSELEHNWHEVSTAKLEALKDIIDASNGESVLVFYQYQHELSRMQDYLASYNPVQFNGQPELLEQWNDGKIQVLLCHPASVAYGLNMQRGGHIIVWYTLTWNLEHYQQANARLHRQGQQKPVLIYHLIAEKTIDAKVYKALQAKTSGQDALMQAIKEIKENYGEVTMG